MVALAVSVLVAGAGWLGFTRSEIDRTIAPLEEETFNLQSAHGRLDDRVTREIARLDHEKVDNTTRLEMLADLNRRISALERIVELTAERANLTLQQATALSNRVEDLVQRVRQHERAMDDERYGGGSPRDYQDSPP